MKINTHQLKQINEKQVQGKQISNSLVLLSQFGSRLAGIDSMLT